MLAYPLECLVRGDSFRHPYNKNFRVLFLRLKYLAFLRVIFAFRVSLTDLQQLY